MVATGFLRLGVHDDEPDDKIQAEYDELDDIMGKTGAAFLGSIEGWQRGQFLILFTPRPASSGDTRDGSDNRASPSPVDCLGGCIPTKSVDARASGLYDVVEIALPTPSREDLHDPSSLCRGFFGSTDVEGLAVPTEREVLCIGRRWDSA